MASEREDAKTVTNELGDTYTWSDEKNNWVLQPPTQAPSAPTESTMEQSMPEADVIPAMPKKASEEEEEEVAPKKEKTKKEKERL